MQKTLGLISEFSLQTLCHTQSLHPGLNIIQVHREWQQALSKSNKCLSCWFVLHPSITKFSMGEMDFSFTFHFRMLFEIVWNKQRVQKATNWKLTQNSPIYCLLLLIPDVQTSTARRASDDRAQRPPVTSHCLVSTDWDFITNSSGIRPTQSLACTWVLDKRLVSFSRYVYTNYLHHSWQAEHVNAPRPTSVPSTKPCSYPVAESIREEAMCLWQGERANEHP